MKYVFLMACIVVHCIKPKNTTEKRILIINPNEKIRLGRTREYELPRQQNGLFRIEKPYVSHSHAFIIFSNNQFYLEDNSTNGTFINEKQIEKNIKTPLMTGDVVQLSKNKIGHHYNLPIVLFYIRLFLEPKENISLSQLEEDYPNGLNLYNNYPTFSFNLDYLYNCTLQRFEILQHLNKFGEVEFGRKTGIEPIVEELKQYNADLYYLVTRKYKSLDEEYLALRCDEASHFILRIACCRNFPLRKWLIKQELKLIYIKWFYFNIYEKNKILLSNGLNYTKADDSEIKKLNVKKENFLNPDLDYFKVPFEEASNLLKNKLSLIENGLVFVQIDDMINPIMSKLDSTMDTTMKYIKKRLHNIWDDKRIVSIIKYIERNIHFDRYTFSQKESKIRCHQIENLSESFPLCMKILHAQLIKYHHLRNGGRFQYSLFLKAIGLSLPNALEFWRTHFTKKIPLDQFMKEYSYHIKHVYGVVGKMADYPPQNCTDIIKAIPGPLDYHGCPFKVLDKTRLKNVLNANNIDKKTIDEILEIAQKGLPQIACTKYFDDKHNTTSISAIKHPNLYYESSRKIRIEYENAAQEKSVPSAQNSNKLNCLSLKW